MNPFEIIEAQINDLNKLKYKLTYSKDKINDANTINTIVDTLNCFNDMLTSKYYTSVLESLIYSLMYDYFMKHEVYKGGDLPIVQLISKLRMDINMPKDAKKLDLINLLRGYELQNIDITEENLQDLTDFDKLISNLVNNFKTEIAWNKK